MYWSEIGSTAGGVIKRSNLDGTATETIITGLPVNYASGFSLDTASGKIYYSASSTSFGVRRANLDGTGEETLFSANLWDLTLDIDSGTIYGSNGNSLYSGMMDGSGMLTHLYDTGDTIFKVLADTDSGFLYYTQPNSSPSGSVKRIGLDGSGDSLLYNAPSPWQSTGIGIASVVPIPAAAWLFGSGLLGLVGMARRKKA